MFGICSIIIILPKNWMICFYTDKLRICDASVVPCSTIMAVCSPRVILHATPVQVRIRII